MKNKILQGQTAIVSGGGRGIGREISIALANAGANVVLCARTQKEIMETAEVIKKNRGQARAIQTDVTDELSVENMVNETLEEFGTIDLIVNNAGTSSEHGRIWEISAASWWKTIDVNLRGPFLLTRAGMKIMTKRKKGRIINIASNAAFFSLPEFSSYSVSKAGLLRLTGSTSLEGKQYGIYAFAISPGLVNTDMTRDLGIWKDVPADEWSPVELTGELCVFLASGKADGLSGRYIHITDDIEKMIKNEKEIIEKNLYNTVVNKLE